MNESSFNKSNIVRDMFDKNYLSLLLLVLCVLVVFGNVLVILSVVKERSLQTITNYFIVSLALADLCVAGVVMPFYTYTLVRKRFSYLTCHKRYCWTFFRVMIFFYQD